MINSLEISEMVDKQHKTVLRDIRKFITCTESTPASTECALISNMVIVGGREFNILWLEDEHITLLPYGKLILSILMVEKLEFDKRIMKTRIKTLEKLYEFEKEKSEGTESTTAGTKCTTKNKKQISECDVCWNTRGDVLCISTKGIYNCGETK